VHIEVTDEPNTMEYKVNAIVPDDVIKVIFRLGFRVEQRVNYFLRMVIQDMVANGEIDIISQYNSLRELNIVGDFRFVILEEFLSHENDLPTFEQFVMSSYISIKSFTASPERWFGLDTSVVVTEKVPLLIRPVSGITLRRLA
jgi:KUP system potassium uptake protein